MQKGVFPLVEHGLSVSFEKNKKMFAQHANCPGNTAKPGDKHQMFSMFFPKASRRREGFLPKKRLSQKRWRNASDDSDANGVDDDDYADDDDADDDDDDDDGGDGSGGGGGTHVCMQVCTHVRMYVCMYACMKCVSMYVCWHGWVDGLIDVCGCVRVCVCVCMQVGMHACVY